MLTNGNKWLLSLKGKIKKGRNFHTERQQQKQQQLPLPDKLVGKRRKKTSLSRELSRPSHRPVVIIALKKLN